MCRIEDELVQGRFDASDHSVVERGAEAWLLLLVLVIFVVCGLFLSGCATTKAASNVSEDIQLVLDRVHLDAQEVIAHPERWAPAVDSLCHDGMITADQCVRIQAILRARAILIGPQSRIHPFKWEVRRCPV